MSDRGPSDHQNRGSVKNPLLSTAVVGLCLDDLTHNAVLLPVSENPGLIPSQDLSTQMYAHAPAPTEPPAQDEKNRKTTQTNDDFDVNEYIARLQGTRYVSAPINTSVDDNTNFESAEQNLEEISLNEPSIEDAQHSLTSDIAQNFSQLPTVLPQVASAVFSSFSNMLRAKTPDVAVQTTEYRDAGVGVVEISPPPPPLREIPKEPPTGCTPQSYRITTKKKAYAQIPGLSANNTVTIADPTSYNKPPQNLPSLYNQSASASNIPQNNPSQQNTSFNITPQNDFSPINISQQSIEIVDSVNTKNVDVTDFRGNELRREVSDEVNATIGMYPVHSEIKSDVMKSEESLQAPPLANQTAHNTVIPPPVMFPNEPKKDVSEVGRTVLPPSVARKLSNSQLVVKPSNIPQYEANIFVPTFDSSQETVPPPAMFNILSTSVPFTSNESVNPQPGMVFEDRNVEHVQIFNPMPTQSEANKNLYMPHRLNQPDLVKTLDGQPSAKENQIPHPMFDPESIIQPREEPLKPVPEPPKAMGPANYRLTKKRPQYYAGPIEGVGNISNNVKPILQPVDCSSFQGALFTPDVPPQQNQAIQSVVDNTIKYDVFAPISQGQPNVSAFGQQPYEMPTSFGGQTHNDTAFDFSRQSTDIYEPPKQEGIGFGIIGSLKSKLTSIDLNKIQSSVTTFFDPAYNDKTKEKPAPRTYEPYQTQYPNTSYNQDQSFGITVSDNYQCQPQQNYGYPSDSQSQYNLSYQYANQQINQPLYQQNYCHPQYGQMTNQWSNLSGTENVQYYPNTSQYCGSNVELKEQEIQTNIPCVSEAVQATNRHDNIETQTDLKQDEIKTQSPHPVLHENVQTESQFEIQNNQCIQTLHMKLTQQNISEHFYSQTDNLLQPAAFVPLVPHDTEKSHHSVHESSNIEKSKTNTDQGFSEPSTFENSDKEKNVQLSTQSSLATSTVGFFDGKELTNPIEIPSSFAPYHTDISKQTVADIAEYSKSAGLERSTQQQKDTSNSEPHEHTFAPSYFQLPSMGDHTAKNFFENIDCDPNANQKCSTLESQEANREIQEIEKEVSLLTLTNIAVTDSYQSSTFSNTQLSEAQRDSQKSFEDKIQAIDDAFANSGYSKFVGSLNDKSLDEPEQQKTSKFDVTSKLIQNITSPIQLSNSVEVPFDSNTPVQDRLEFDTNQCEEITHITEETIETIQIQSVNELLDEKDAPVYGWCHEPTPSAHTISYDYDFQQPDPSSIGFFDKTILEDVNFLQKAGDEIKPELKSESHVLTRQMSIPTAPPEEDIDETKSDVTGGLDVHSIEQDAKNDFAVFEEYVIEPEPGTKNDKQGDSKDNVDSFTQRVEKFQSQEQPATVTETPSSNPLLFNVPTSTSPAITIASYFDTGNYAADSHYRKSLTSPTSVNSFLLGSPSQTIQSIACLATVVNPQVVPSERHTNIGKESVGIFAPNLSIAELTATTTSTMADITSRVMPFSAMFQETHPKDSEAIKGIKPVFAEIFANDKTCREGIPFIPETETQTVTKTTVKDSVSTNLSRNVTVTTSYVPHTTFPDIVKDTRMCGDGGFVDSMDGAAKQIETQRKELKNLIAYPSPVAAFKQEVLPNPLDFFASSKTAEEKIDSDADANRLASYFTSPKKTDQSKPFSELSQSQDHFRDANNSNTNIQNTFNIPQEQFNANLNLMKELTSVQNYEPSKDQTVRTVNYFTVQLSENNDDLKIRSSPISLTKPEERVSNDDTKNCQLCANSLTRLPIDVRTESSSVKKAMDNVDASKVKPSKEVTENAAAPADRGMSVSFNVPDEQDEERQAILTEQHRQTAHYVPVEHHWFYRVDKEDRSLWRGFSVADSKALEEAYLSPDLNDNTTVATEGGRYDVNIRGRLRVAVYWKEKPSNVRRCSWYYKGNTDARYVPYTEDVAEVLEAEYALGIKTGQWHRRVALSSGESVVMHTATVMVHLSNAPDDAWTGTRIFDKKVYRMPIHVGVIHDELEKVDHLLMVVHGAGQWWVQKDQLQAALRPRVVQRGRDDSEIEDTEPGPVEHLLLLCHGVGQYCDMRLRHVEAVVDEFRSSSLQLIKNHYKSSYDRGDIGRIEVLPISWHESLHAGEQGVDHRLARITLDSIPLFREFTNDTVLDVLLYTSPLYCQKIINTVGEKVNEIYTLFMKRNPNFTGTVSVGGHSLGSVILYDILCHQTGESGGAACAKSYLHNAARLPDIKFPTLLFKPAALYAFGSPIAIFECIRGVELLGEEFRLPTCPKLFNIFHPHDPIAFRMEPLVNPELKGIPPALIPHHKGRKRLHLELKETLARVGSDIKSRLVESLKASWLSVWRSEPPPTSELEKVVEEEIEKEKEQESKQEMQDDIAKQYEGRFGQLNSGQRIDYVLQEAPMDSINPYISAITKHCCYWESEDTILLILREVYSALGVSPDGSRPPPSLTVERNTNPDQSPAHLGTASTSQNFV